MYFPKYFTVIPCIGKAPSIKWQQFVDQAPTEAEMVNWPDSSGRGIICGPVSKLFVLDDDSIDGASLKSRVIPRTATVRTPRGGRHYYFKWVDALNDKVTTKTGVLDKVDVRGHGGFVAFYGWETSPLVAPLAHPPQWLIDLLPKKDFAGMCGTRPSVEDDNSVPANFAPAGLIEGAPAKAARDADSTSVQGLSKFQEVIDGIKEGNRNESFTKLAGSLRARGYRVEEIFDLLQPKAVAVGFPEKELRTICQSVGRYEPHIVDTTQGMSIDVFLRDTQKVEWICEPLIAKGAIGFVAGLPEAGKTWLLIDLAIECARGGGLWLKKFPVKAAKVLFIDQERAKSETQRRFKSVLAGKSMDGRSLSKTLWIRCGSTTRIDLQHSFDAFRKELSDIQPDIVIVDSFATWHTKEESNRMEIQQVIERTKQLRNEFGCTFLFVHHETKMAYSNRKEGATPTYLDMAGNVAIPAAAETAFSVVKRDDNSSFVHHTKNTLAPKIAPFLIRVADLNPEKTKIVVEAF